MMTVAELIKELQALPQDIQIMMLDSDRESPVEIVQVSRGTWGLDLADEQDERLEAEYGDNEIPEDVVDGLTDYDTERFYQDDENGKIAVLVVW
jgi:hypothetical protein